MVSRTTMPNPNTDAAPEATDSDNDWANRLRSVLDARSALLVELNAASADQEAVIESRDTASLLELLAGRQRIVDRFVAGQPELLALTQSFDERLVTVAPAAADELRLRMRQLSEGLARITQRDEAAQMLLRQAKDETHAEMMRTNAGVGARQAYAGAKPSSNMFADRRG